MGGKFQSLLFLLLLGVNYSVFAQANSPVNHAISKREVVVANSSGTEARPLISFDGNSLYFSRRYHPENMKGVKDFQDVWVSELDTLTGQWSEPKNLGPVINNKRRNAIASLSPDGMDAIFFNTYKKTKKMPLVRSRKSGSSWTKPKVIHIDNYVNVSDFSDYYVDFNNKILILAIQADSTVGDQDLYVSFLDPYGGWKEPVNMGPVINSDKADFAPFIGADGRALFFCSYGHNSLGESDIYMSVRLDDSWLRWSKPVNLGPSINTEHEETYFSITGDYKYLYYTSYPAKTKDRNIVRVTLPDDFMTINGPLLVQLDSASRQEVLLSGNFTHESKGRSSGSLAENFPKDVITPAADREEDSDIAAVVAKEIEKAIFAGSGTKGEQVAAVSGLSEAAREMKGYLERAFPDLTLEVKQKEDTVEFKVVQNLLYDFNSIYVRSEYLQRLSKMGRILREKPALKIEFVGFTDNIGDENVNNKIARQRVEILVYYFKDRKIDTERLRIKGVGANHPVASNDSEEGRMQNRRVETTILFIEK